MNERIYDLLKSVLVIGGILYMFVLFGYYIATR